MDRIFQQLLTFLRGLSAKQRLILGGSTLLIGATIFIFVKLLGAGDYKTLYSGMAPADAQSLAQRLASQNISCRISSDGASVLVPSSQLDKARLEAASQGPLATGRMGFELFDKPNWSGSDFSERVNYQRALEGELERTIGTMNGVVAVRVHLVLPHESLFADRERPAKAAVVLKLRGTRLNDQIASSVANLVSSSWDDLSPQNVTVVTTDGQMPNQAHGRFGNSPDGAQDLETSLAERIIQTLAPVVGADHVKSSVTIDYDPTSGDSTQEIFDPNTTAVLTSQISQETVGDLQPSGIPGTPSNTPNSQGAPAAAAQAVSPGSTQGIRSESKTFAVSRTTHHTIEPAGRIRRVAAAVLVDDASVSQTADGKTQQAQRKRTPEEMKQIEDLAKAAMGFDAQRGDQISVQNIAFQAPVVESPQPPGRVERIVTLLERWTGALRYAALLLLFAVVYLAILRPVKRQVVAILQTSAMTPSLAAHTAGGAIAPGEVSLRGAPALPGETVSPEAQHTVRLKTEIASRVKENPESASRLIQNWIREPEARK